MPTVDFTNTEPAQGYVVLTKGPKKGIMVGCTYKAEKDRYQFSISTPEGLVGEGFSMPSGAPYLMAMFVSGGYPKEALKKRVDPEKLAKKLIDAKRSVYFDYAPPSEEGGFPHFSWLTKSQYEKAISNSDNTDDDDIEVTPEEKPVKPTKTATKTKTPEPDPDAEIEPEVESTDDTDSDDDADDNALAFLDT